ncbi:hypothetical protein UFOVP1307_103 [uncultured Caudovirales phage]|uniref:Uncharacterized protein n=1 Tax=uncultured Caudovirales phage TaxID=2100421 RepID=A0A6J5PH25_9CAUD|nr:hypothetical protein UFOVP651_20 [uncultured Caudovirales phage]CAB4170743.1 hypothetical protein UFOVP902_99 [uncultured Caudovirales phage]CAB4198466.1 hypothetical protein UFOVP1307_103 [uncultured Caudovirales phage]
MNTKISKETLMLHGKKMLNIIILVGAATAFFKLGEMYAGIKRETPKAITNPYAHAFSPEEVSIAVNESNELIMIERRTGNYIVYSDAIGQTIFGMYANRLHQEANVIK